ncbi:MAG: helix-turn-helix transcriptional regulator [Cloacibacterium sp.]|nr:helix-turn-helix transcriptional regulator [Cloacibacterium sp.]
MDLNERIVKVIEYSTLSASEFADEVEVQRSNISHITSGRNKPSLDFIVKIKDRFPEISWDWLIKGDGEMLSQKNSEEATTLPSSSTPNEKESTSLPDLFTLINEETIPEKIVTSENSRESDISDQSTESKKINDSQRLEQQEIPKNIEITDNQQNKVKRIVFFFENGTFEIFEP